MKNHYATCFNNNLLDINNKFKIISIALLYISQFIAISSFSQSINVKLGDRYRDDSVTALAKTNHFYWIGTTNGLWCISKKSGKTFRYLESNSNLPSNFITAICTRKNGDLWVGTDNGLLRFDCCTDIRVDYAESNSSHLIINSIVEDARETLWIATDDEVIKIIQNQWDTFYAKNSNLPDDKISSLMINEQGEVIIHMQKRSYIPASYLKHNH